MKKVLITGASKGLGASLAMIFAKNNYDLLLTYNTNYEDIIKVKDEICRNYNVVVNIEKCDLSNEKDIVNLFENNVVDILINNAALSMDNDIMLKSKDEFMNVLDVNVVGTFLMIREAIRHGIKEVVNISSTDSIDTFSSMNIDYSISKSGINLMTKVFSNYYTDVRIFSVLPNWINTESVMEMNQEYLYSELKRIGQQQLLDKDEVADEIFKLYNNKNIKSGELIRIDYEGGLCIKILE